jgi:hypothetical protein
MCVESVVDPGLVSIPLVLFHHMSELNDVLSLFVLLTRFKGVLIFPSKSSSAALAVNIRNGMESSEKDAFLCWTTSHIHYRVEEVCPSLTSLKRL